MGDTKNFRRVWKKPKRPFNFELKMDELKTVGTFGLKTKRELWKSRTELSRLRHQARSLLAVRQEVREKEEPILMHSLSRIGLVEKSATLDDVLNLEINDLLARRLQTIVFKKFFFKIMIFKQCPVWDLNPQPLEYESRALPLYHSDLLDN